MFRSQVSLIFNDEKLYTDFIKPLSSERQLMPMIVKLLSSYFYNDDTRVAVDGTSISSQKEQSEYVSDDNRELQEKLADIRASAQLLGMFVQDSKATLEEGMDAINNIAKATGGSVSRETENGMSVPRISMKGIDALHSEAQSVKSLARESESNEGSNIVVRDPRVDDLKKDVEDVKSDISQILSILKGVSVLALNPSENNDSLDIHTLVPTVEQQTEAVSGDVFKSSESQVDEDVAESAEKAEVNEVEVKTEVTDEVKTEEVKEEPVEEAKKSTEEQQSVGRNMLRGMLSGGGVGGFL